MCACEVPQGPLTDAEELIYIKGGMTALRESGWVSKGENVQINWIEQPEAA